jgi:hypothetical protein
MSEISPDSFLCLPTELRLEVFKLLLSDCLATGHVAPLAGLFMCCREIHHELEAEFMAEHRPLLQAMHACMGDGRPRSSATASLTKRDS